jgi:hypothetical protein
MWNLPSETVHHKLIPAQEIPKVFWKETLKGTRFWYQNDRILRAETEKVHERD